LLFVLKTNGFSTLFSPWPVVKHIAGNLVSFCIGGRIEGTAGSTANNAILQPRFADTGKFFSGLSHIITGASSKLNGTKKHCLWACFCSVFVRVFRVALPIQVFAEYGVKKGNWQFLDSFMEREVITRIGPVCRFGPGGDYVSVWPVDWTAHSEQPKSQFGRLRNMLVGFIDTLRGTGSTQIAESSRQRAIIRENHYYASKHRRVAYAKAGSALEHNRRVQGQTWLFADDWRAVKGPVRKPHHRIRAHRAVAKKRTSFAPASKGTLFDAQLKSAKTA